MSTSSKRSSATADRLDALIPGAFPDSLRSPSVASIATHTTPLTQILYERRAEYTRPRSIRIKIGSWNVAAQKGTEQDVGSWFVRGKGVEEALAGLGVTDDDNNNKNVESVRDQEARFSQIAPTTPHGDAGLVPGDDDIDLYVLGLQEIVDITSAAEALKPYTDPTQANKWKSYLEAALPSGYKLVAEQQLLGLWLVIYASPSLAPHVKNVSTTSVGTGLMGYMANKGAVTARLVLGETTRLVFVNSHLGAGADKAALQRRNWDFSQIASRTRFAPIIDSLGASQAQGEGLGDEEFAFWFGDLNYRIEGMGGDDVRRLLTVHTMDLDAEKPPTDQDSPDAVPDELDPASLQTTISCLLPHDELHQQMKSGKAFHDGWEEGPIRFLPTYKYDVGKVGVFDSSEKRRCPSWCDRIVYRTRAGKQRYETKVIEQDLSRKRDEDMKAMGMDMPGNADVLFDYDPETDGDTYDEYEDNEQSPEPEPVTTRDGFEDELLLEYYTSHMRVLSSDHKPLDAVFSLKFDAVMPDLKAAIHTEVARELDRQENEGRPAIAVVVERATASPTTDDTNTTDSAFDGVDFDNVKFAKSKRRNITIANTGRVPATFGFADRPIEQEQKAGPFPPWLSVTFDRDPDKRDKAGPDDVQERYTLQPGDTLNAELKLKVESLSAVRKLNDDDITLEDVLVVRVENGRDHFLPLRGRWQQSALARTVDKLIKIPEGGIRRLQHQTPDSSEVKWSVPREIFRLTEAIEDVMERTLAEWDMTKGENERAPWQDNAGWPFTATVADEYEDEYAGLFDALDCDTPLEFEPSTSAHKRTELLAVALLTFLQSLTDGILTAALCGALDVSISARPKSRTIPVEDEKLSILEILATAPPHNASFLLIISMLQNLLHQLAEAARRTEPASATPRSSVDFTIPASPQAKVRRSTLSRVPEEAVRQLVSRNFAIVFAGVLSRDDANGVRESVRAARRERMVRVVEVFLLG
jgi:phosphatidylinositol-bisphosphatase